MAADHKTRPPLWFKLAIAGAVVMVTLGVLTALMGDTSAAAVLVSAAGQAAMISALVREQEQRDRE